MIAVVGGRGFIGAAIVARLRSAGLEVVCVTHSAEHARRPGFRFGDMLAPDTLADAVAGAEVVVQSANFRDYPIEHRRRGETFAAFDAAGTEQLVAAARRAGVRRYLFIAGAGTRGGGPTPYWDALRRGEQAVLGSGLQGICIEPTLVYGPRDRGLNRMLALARRSPVVPILGGRSAVHQPVFVEDVAELAFRAIAADTAQGVFPIGGPERMSMLAMVRRTLAAAGLRRPVLTLPGGPVRVLARLAAMLPGEPLNPAAVDFMLESFTADLEPSRNAFSLCPRPFEEGLRSYLAPSARAAAGGLLH